MSIFENTIASFLRDPATTPIKKLYGFQLTPPDYQARWLDQSLFLLNMPFGTVRYDILVEDPVLTLLGTPW